MKKYQIFFLLSLFLIFSLSLVSADSIPSSAPCWVKGNATSTDFTVNGLVVEAYLGTTLLKNGTIASGDYSLNSVGANDGDIISLKVYGHTFATISSFEGYCKTGDDPWIVVDEFTISKQANDQECSNALICTSGYCTLNVCSAAATTTSSPSSSGTTTTSYWTTTYIVDDDDFESGYSKSLGKKKRLKVTVENETHYVGVVALTNTTATINVSSEVQQEIFNIGNTHKFEVTNDTYYDIEVKLNNIYDNKANITVTSIHEEIIVEEVNETIINNQENQTINTTIIPEDVNNTKEDNIPPTPAKEKTTNENLYLFAIIIILIIVYIIINIIRKKTKKKKNRLDINDDGKVDEKDVTLAKKVIKFYKKKKRK